MKINTQEQFYKVKQINKLPQLNKNDMFQGQEPNNENQVRQLKTQQQRQSMDFQLIITKSYKQNAALPTSTKNLEKNRIYLPIPNRIQSPKALGEKKEDLCSSFMTTSPNSPLKQSKKFEPNDILEIIKQKKNPKQIKEILRNEQNNFVELKQKKCEELCQLKIEYNEFLEQNLKMSPDEFKKENKKRIDKIKTLQQQTFELEETLRLSEQNLSEMDFGPVKLARYYDQLEKEFVMFKENLKKNGKIK